MASRQAHAQPDWLGRPSLRVMRDAAIITALARSMVAGEQTIPLLRDRLARTLGRRYRWIPSLVARYNEEFNGGPRPRYREVSQFLADDFYLNRALARGRVAPVVVANWLADSSMAPVDAARHWNLPAILTETDLADWLCLSPTELLWYADLKGLLAEPCSPKLRHYRYTFIPKRTGGVRLIESPKSNLKEIQRRILSGILNRVPAHSAAHGFVKDRSIATFAAPHVGQEVVLRIDPPRFLSHLPRIPRQGILPHPRLSGTRGRPAWGPLLQRRFRRHLEEPSRRRQPRRLAGRPEPLRPAAPAPGRSHFARRGEPYRVSPGLPTFRSRRHRRRGVHALCRRPGVFRAAKRSAGPSSVFSTHAAAIALEEGFSVNHRKTRIMGAGARQQIAGVVVNRKVSLRRRDWEQLEAILTNCIRRGPETQNRENVADFQAHLQGRVAYAAMVDPVKAQRLKSLFASIRWP